MEKVENIKGSFLNNEQKNVKQKIMEDLLEALFGNIENNIELFDNQALMDLILSILLMFNREILVNILSNSTAIQVKDEFMDDLFKTIKLEVNKQLKENSN